jgi:hypothetical protein
MTFLCRKLAALFERIGNPTFTVDVCAEMGSSRICGTNYLEKCTSNFCCYLVLREDRFMISFPRTLVAQSRKPHRPTRNNPRNRYRRCAKFVCSKTSFWKKVLPFLAFQISALQRLFPALAISEPPFLDFNLSTRGLLGQTILRSPGPSS